MAATVTVALKMPHGIICRMQQMTDVEEPLPGGGFKTVKRARYTGQSFKLNGYLRPARGDEPPPPASPGAFALTHGVDKEMFEAWLKQNADLDIIRNNLVFASESKGYTVDEAREKKGIKCGFEPIDRGNLPRGISDAREKEKAA